MTVGAYWRRTRAVACVNCGLMCLNPRWTDAEYGLYYEACYYDQYQPSVGTAQGPSVPRSERAATILRLAGGVSRSQGSVRVLEIGCGAGTNVIAMMASRPSGLYVGLEPDVAMCAALARQCPQLTVIPGTVSSASSQLQDIAPFDFVILSHVLEHFADPVEALRTVRSLLAPEGHMICLVPDVGALAPFHDQFTVPHTHYFTRRTFDAVLKRAGFQIESFVADLPGEICALATLAVEHVWAGSSDLALVEGRCRESGKARALIRTGFRRTVESLVPESVVHRLLHKAPTRVRGDGRRTHI